MLKNTDTEGRVSYKMEVGERGKQRKMQPKDESRNEVLTEFFCSDLFQPPHYIDVRSENRV